MNFFEKLNQNRLNKFKEESKSKEKSRTIASEVLDDGTIIEMLLDPIKKETSLAICKEGNISFEKLFNDNGTKLKPYSADNNLIRTKTILFPSQPEEYDSQAELIHEIQEFIHKYLSVSEFFEQIASYYVLFTWIHDNFNELPYLRGLGDYGTGKSRFLQVVGSICYRPIFASGATTVSPIFRMLNDFKGTLILDEADFKFSDTTAEIVKILNQGFMKGIPVIRSENSNGNEYNPQAFEVFGAKILSTRFLYKDAALESRMITEDMNLNSPRSDIPFNMPDSFREEALEIRNKLLMFRFRNKGKIKLKPELENREIEPRLNQIAVPLMSIVDDSELVKEIQEHIREYNEKIKTDRTLNLNYQILDAICQLIDNGLVEPTIKEIAFKFNEDLDPFETITAKKMGYFVSKHLNLKTSKSSRGYVLSRDNRKTIEMLRKRYAIDQKKDISGGMNNVNDMNIASEDSTEEIPLNNLF